jgi:uncharacterized protein (DUF169 family)
MDLEFKEKFTELWKKYFGSSELPITFYYSDNHNGIDKFSPPQQRHCLICDLARVRKGKSTAFDNDSIGCRGAKRYLGFSDKIGPDFNYFLSCGIPGKLEGERYLKNPELVSEWMKKNESIKGNKEKYIIFRRWDKLEERDDPEVVIFFAKPDVLSGLFTLANYDQAKTDSTIAPFGAGCGSIVHYPYLEKDRERPRAVLGMFDPSARPCVPEDVLTFAIPMVKFKSMVDNIEESFLITDSWKEVSDRIKA